MPPAATLCELRTMSRHIRSQTTVARCCLVALLFACASAPPAAVPASSQPPDASVAQSSAAAAHPAEPEQPGAAPHPGAQAHAGAIDSEHHEGSASSAGYLIPERSAGLLQSPINISTSRAVPGEHAVALHYQTSHEHVTNLGHTVRVAYDAGSSIEFDARTYDFAQFHFHTPSEHLLDGVTYPMEMHLVHLERGNPEHYLVVGVLFKEGSPDALLDTLLEVVPPTVGETADEETLLDASTLFSPGEGYYHYEGSLTTPPYSEAVDWLVLKRIHEASAEQIQAFNRIEGNNARHIQELRTRLIDRN